MRISIKKYPYEMYCAGCDTLIAYLSEKPEIGSVVGHERAINLDGTKPKAGDEIVHNCDRWDMFSARRRPEAGDTFAEDVQYLFGVHVEKVKAKATLPSTWKPKRNTIRPILKMLFYSAIGLAAWSILLFDLAENKFSIFACSIVMGFYIGEAAGSLAGLRNKK